MIMGKNSKQDILKVLKDETSKKTRERGGTTVTIGHVEGGSHRIEGDMHTVSYISHSKNSKISPDQQQLITLLEKHDIDGDYIRKYISELLVLA